jgi:hypothetical protein
MIGYLPDARISILTYHKGTQRSYIFVMNSEDGRRYTAILQKFLYTNWSRVFTEESPEKNSPSRKSVGGKLELEMDSGVIATITAQEDGWITIQFSDQPGRSTRTRIDHFLSNYRR